ncbi:reducing type I polyketide synthase [Poronia punctata]|nr:reducing type I polyketide synthase [Poronia punctata]
MSRMAETCKTPVAIVGMACRLPGRCRNPRDLWELMKNGRVASNEPPASRFNISGHYDSSLKPFTMKTPGGMFMEHVDPADFDAPFFNISFADAISMDPQQRLLMEVSYECLESAGIARESLGGKKIGCIIGASAVDYQDMGCRDPEDRVFSPTLGLNRALLSNRISHFFNIQGPSLTVDTACSSTLIAVDLACLYLQSGQADGVLIGGTNLFLSPERNQDMGAMRTAASATGRCHVFDVEADGYVTAEAINMVYVKRLDDAVRDRDAIRAVILGTASNSSGRTPGITMPSAEAQAAVIRACYANAGIPVEQYSQTGYVECHGTGTLAGDPIEIAGLSLTFGQFRSASDPLIIGSVKGNIGHSEAAAGLSGLVKAVLAIEKGVIPGTATFITPNPAIDFEGAKVRASRRWSQWPSSSKRRASINSFGFGGANAHVVIESPEYLLHGVAPFYKSTYLDMDKIDDAFFEDVCSSDGPQSKEITKPLVLVVSANDEKALKASVHALSSHVINPTVEVSLDDLAYTLSERRSRLHHRSYSIRRGLEGLSAASFVTGSRPRIGDGIRLGLVFSGQGAQWPMMGRDMIRELPLARKTIESLDMSLAALSEPPGFSLLHQLTADLDPLVLRDPVISQPLTTALQLAYLAVLSDWGIRPRAVIGHSSGEIAAAVAAGYLTAQEGIRVAYLRGLAIKRSLVDVPLGMLAVGLMKEVAQTYISHIDDTALQIACYNSPKSVTVSGPVSALKQLQEKLQLDGHFARMLQVDTAYHSKHIHSSGQLYRELLLRQCPTSCSGSHEIAMYSTVNGTRIKEPMSLAYWVDNMVSPVQFNDALSQMIASAERTGSDSGVNFLVEVGPSNTLAGPIAQILESESLRKAAETNENLDIPYYPIAKRGPDTLLSLYHVAGAVFAAGGPVDFSRVNEYGIGKPQPSLLVDLPSYTWTHSTKYWHEGLASRDWRYRQFPRHDLLGSKILGTSWNSPTWRNRLSTKDMPWLVDHKLGELVVFPGSGYICMAMEAAYQTMAMVEWTDKEPDAFQYRFRDIKFTRALVLDEGSENSLIMLSLSKTSVLAGSWYEFKILSNKGAIGEVWQDHATGLVRLESEFTKHTASEDITETLHQPVSAAPWYKYTSEVGFTYGPAFQKHLTMESTSGQRIGRSHVSMEPPSSPWKQSRYVIHPVCMDGCFQTVVGPVHAGDYTSMTSALVPTGIKVLVIPARAQQPSEAISHARANYAGIGRMQQAKNYSCDCSVYDPNDGSLIMDMSGLRFSEQNPYQNAKKPQVYSQLIWDVDISKMTYEIVNHVAQETVSDQTARGERGGAMVGRFLDLVAFKKPNLRVLEVNLDSSDASSTWLDEHRTYTSAGMRAAFSGYVFMSDDANSIVTVRDRYGTPPNIEYIMGDFEESGLNVAGQFDLIIVKCCGSRTGCLHSYHHVLENIKLGLSDDGLAILCHAQNDAIRGPSNLDLEGDDALSIFQWEESIAIIQRLQPRPKREEGICISKNVYLVRIGEAELIPLQKGLANDTLWNMICLEDPFQVPPHSQVLIVDELENAIISSPSPRQWNILKYLIESSCAILWVTKGAQMEVDEPSRSTIFGMFRVIRNEEPQLSLINLDVENAFSLATIRAIDACLLKLGKSNPLEDTEFVERRGIIHISRVFPDTLLSNESAESPMGRALEPRKLHASKETIRLKAERVGEIDSLSYTEHAPQLPSLAPGFVEIEVKAAGVNFKDVAAVIGIIPEDEHRLGGEGSGVISRVASDVTWFQEGQRVAFFARGAFGNRVRAKADLVQEIPKSMSFVEAATIPCVYMTAVYSLFHLCQVKKGDRVLIHSAAGGVGLAAVQICLHLGAIIYATVGTPEKRTFLKIHFDIPDSRIFSSRNTCFVDQIFHHTGGKGVHVILNSLAGDLLEASWSIIADNGTMIEMGKKDIIENKSLSLEPFSRGATYRAFDMGTRSIDDDLKSRLLKRVFELLNDGHVNPIPRINKFSFTDIPSALRMIRGGGHIGKAVICDDGSDNNDDVTVLVRPFSRSMSICADKAYLIVGGLKGICGKLAVYFARNGAKDLSIMTRSRFDDELSQKAASDIRAYGCRVHLVQGDVTSIDDVRAAFHASHPVPVGGIIHGAMVLRDRTFASMTLDEFQGALDCKVKGTWALHTVSMEHGPSVEFFTMLSSLSGVCGTKGQANYAAGSAFLDAFACYRHRLGLPACSLDLGIVEDIGYMANHEDVAQRHDESIWQRLNERTLQRAVALSVIEQQQISGAHIISTRSRTQILTGMHVPQPENSPLLLDARFLGLHIADVSSMLTKPKSNAMTREGVKKEVQVVLTAIRSNTKPQPVLLSMAVKILGHYLSKGLRLSDPLDPTRPLSIYGIDSLAAVEFRNFIKMEFGVEISALEIVDASSLNVLCEKMIDRIKRS